MLIAAPPVVKGIVVELLTGADVVSLTITAVAN